MSQNNDSVLIALPVAIMILTVFVFLVANGTIGAGTGEYQQVDYEYTVEFKPTNVVYLCEITFDAERDGYMVLNFGSNYSFNTEMTYHAGHNHYLVPYSQMLNTLPEIQFYER